jgi:hypothetical protein
VAMWSYTLSNYTDCVQPGLVEPLSELVDRLERVEAQLQIGQLPIRHAMAVDGRDLDTWASLFVPDVQVGRDLFGREALKGWIAPLLATFRRSSHQICGHRIEMIDADAARGAVYCRAEHEVDDRWIVMGICYFDDYRRIDGQWLFSRRREKHDVLQRYLGTQAEVTPPDPALRRPVRGRLATGVCLAR